MSNTRVCHAKLRRKALLKRAEVFWALPREGAIFGHEGESPENIVKICVLLSGKYVTPTSLSGLRIEFRASGVQGNHSAHRALSPAWRTHIL